MTTEANTELEADDQELFTEEHVHQADKDEAVDADSHDALEKELKKYRQQIARKQRLFNRLGRYTKLLGSLAFIALALVTLLYFNPITTGTRLALVTTSSMEPFIQPGDIALTIKYDAHKGARIGDIVLVKPEEGNQYLHRIIARNADGTYTTQGDNSDLADFTPVTNEMILGQYWNSIEQPVAGVYSFFMLDGQWFEQAWTAAKAKDWTMLGALLPFAPWGWAVLLTLGVFFRAIAPRIINIFIDRANRNAAVEVERLRGTVATQDETIATYEEHFAQLEKSVTAHEGAIGEHDEAIAEVTPVVREIAHEREVAKAEKEASDRAMAAAWANYDPTAPIYDEPETELAEDNAFDVFEIEPAEDSAFDVFETFAPKTHSEGLPALSDPTPRFTPNAPTNPFDRLTPRVSTTRSEVTRASLRAETDEFAALGIRASQQSRNEASAFDLEEI